MAAKTTGGGGKVAANYIAQQTPEKRVLLEKLNAIVVKTLPNATVAIKWGVPFYLVNGKNVCALASFKDFVGLNFMAPPEKLADPGKKLEGAGKTQRMLKVRSASDIDSACIARWLKAAASP